MEEIIKRIIIIKKDNYYYNNNKNYNNYKNKYPLNQPKSKKSNKFD